MAEIITFPTNISSRVEKLHKNNLVGMWRALTSFVDMYRSEDNNHRPFLFAHNKYCEKNTLYMLHIPFCLLQNTQYFYTYILRTRGVTHPFFKGFFMLTPFWPQWPPIGTRRPKHAKTGNTGDIPKILHVHVQQMSRSWCSVKTSKIYLEKSNKNK